MYVRVLKSVPKQETLFGHVLSSIYATRRTLKCSTHDRLSRLNSSLSPPCLPPLLCAVRSFRPRRFILITALKRFSMVVVRLGLFIIQDCNHQRQGSGQAPRPTSFQPSSPFFDLDMIRPCRIQAHHDRRAILLLYNLRFSTTIPRSSLSFWLLQSVCPLPTSRTQTLQSSGT